MSIKRSWRSLWRARKYQALAEEIRLLRAEIDAKTIEYGRARGNAWLAIAKTFEAERNAIEQTHRENNDR